MLQEEVIYDKLIPPNASPQLPDSCSERLLLKDYQGGEKVHEVMLHALKRCGGLDEHIAYIKREILVTHFEERKTFQKADTSQTRQDLVINIVPNT